MYADDHQIYHAGADQAAVTSQLKDSANLATTWYKFICYYKGNTRLNYIKPRLTLLIRDLLKFQAVSCQFDFKSCFLIYADQYFCDLHPHARTPGEHEWHIFQRHKVFQPNAHAQFPWKIPYLII